MAYNLNQVLENYSIKSQQENYKMASIALPAINVGGKVTQQIIRQIPSPPTKGSPMSSSGVRLVGMQRVDLRSRSRNGGAFTKSKQQQEPKSEASFEKIDTARHRNTYEHNLCVDMLKEGFHQSFCEMFNLMRQQREEHDLLGPESGLQDEPLLQDEPEKLDQLNHHLTAAEAAQRRGKMEPVYNSRLALAQFFEQTGDNWLSDHFYGSCLKTSLKIRGDGRRREGEANANMGLALEKRGDMAKAAQYFESFYNLTKGRLWQTDSGENMHSLSCDHLRRVYSTIADEVKKEDMQESIKHLLKAYEMAKEGGDASKEGMAGFRLGTAYEEVGDPETAILYHSGYLEKCQQNSDDVGMGRACQALARAYEMQGDIESSLKYLEMFVELADRSEQLPEQQRACSSLGAIYNSLGKYKDSVRMFKRAYEIANELGEQEAIEQSRVELGVAAAHTVLGGYSECMDNLDKANIQRLLDFKSARLESFTDEGKEEYLAEVSQEMGETKSEGSNTGESGVAADDKGPSSAAETLENQDKNDDQITDTNGVDSGVTRRETDNGKSESV